jgi:outer membrane immunogenic protein
MNKLPVAAGLALALVAGSALAADLPSRKAPPAYIPPPPVFSWTGLYGGVNIGYGFGNGDPMTGGQLAAQNNPAGFFAPVATFDGPIGLWNVPLNLNGVLGGGQVGYNYQFNPYIVLGFETDIQAADLRARQNIVSGYASPFWGVGSTGFATANQYVDWFGTARGRVGLTLPSYPNLMIYGTGGLAYGGVEYNHTYTRTDNFSFGLKGPWVSQASASTSQTRVGWTAGGGVEWTPMAFPAWSLKLEYLYTDLGRVTQIGGGVGSLGAGLPLGAVLSNTSINTTAFRWHTVRAGVNWHFNPFGATAPVLAKY